MSANISTLDGARLLRLIEVGRSLVSELDLESVLARVLEEARKLTGARYAARWRARSAVRPTSSECSS